MNGVLIPYIRRICENDWVFRIVLIAGFVLPLLYILRTELIHDNPRDFRYFWAAGRIWAEGGNPYRSEFSEIAGGFFGIGSLHRWLYSPHTWLFVRPLAAFDFKTAKILWTFVNAVLLYVGTALTVAAVLDFRQRWHWLAYAGLLLCTVVSVGATMTISLGQFAAFSYVAIAAFAYAVMRGSWVVMTVALILLSMKASLALPFVAYAIAAPRWRLSVLAAGAMSLALSLPALVGDPIGVVEGYLDGLGVYTIYGANTAESVTGLRNLIYHLTGADLSGILLSSGAAVIAAALARWELRQDGPHSPIALTFCLSVIIFLVPMHLYDLILVSVLFVGFARWPVVLILGLALALLFRVNRLSDVLGVTDYDPMSFAGSQLASIVLGLLVVVSAVRLIGQQRTNQVTI